jgi:hypothetical protein
MGRSGAEVSWHRSVHPVLPKIGGLELWRRVTLLAVFKLLIIGGFLLRVFYWGFCGDLFPCILD